jgi:hypothetical protein
VIDVGDDGDNANVFPNRNHLMIFHEFPCSR